MASEIPLNQIVCCDSLEFLRTLPDECIQCCVTSPPYWGLRDYEHDRQMGLEETPEAYLVNMVEVFREVRRVLRSDGTLWLNVGDTYSNGNAKKQCGVKPKELIGIPWRMALALRSDGWWLRQDIIWHKPNPMPESIDDRCTKSHEYVFLITKSEKYWYNAESVREPSTNKPSGNVQRKKNVASAVGWQGDIGKSIPYEPTGYRNRRSVWTITPKPCKGAHFAVMPPDLAEVCIRAGSFSGSVVLDPFMGSGTVAFVARQFGRNFVGCEINPEYVQLAKERLKQGVLF